MNPDGHRARAERIERSLEKCVPGDYEIIIEGTMLAASEWVNYALHTWELTTPDRDIIHTYLLAVNDLRRFRVADAAMMDALTAIEDLRPMHVRGGAPGGILAGERSLELLHVIRDKALRSRPSEVVS